MQKRKSVKAQKCKRAKAQDRRAAKAQKSKSAKAQKSKIKLGICGEHGGDPESIRFCQNIGLNYVSCSPYRVPIARLAAAQSWLIQNKKH